MGRVGTAPDNAGTDTLIDQRAAVASAAAARHCHDVQSSTRHR